MGTLQLAGLSIGMNTVGLVLLGGALLLAATAFRAALLERHELYRSLRTIRAIGSAAPDVREHHLAMTFASRVLAPWAVRVASVTKRITPLAGIERELVYAGSPASWDAARVMAAKVAGASVAAVAVLALPIPGATRKLVTLVVIAAGGYIGPDVVLRGRATKRQDAMRSALPDVLDLLAVTVEAGLGFDAAVARVATQGSGPLAEELNRVTREMQLGKSRSAALQDLAERSNLAELKSFVLALVQADAFGVSIAQVLHIQSRELRTKRRQRAEELAQKVPVKMVFPLVFCILPALFVVLLGPAAINLLKA